MPNNIDYDKLQDSLETIKKVCEDHSSAGCFNCPLGDKDGFCKLGICPLKWRPRHPEADVFRCLE